MSINAGDSQSQIPKRSVFRLWTIIFIKQVTSYGHTCTTFTDIMPATSFRNLTEFERALSVRGYGPL